MKRAALIATLLFLSSSSLAQDTAGSRVLGVWATEKAQAHVEISLGENGYHGVITWLQEPFFAADDELAGQPKTDRENPDPQLRKRSILGLRIMEGFQYEGGNRWAGGTIYDPENGRTYRCKLQLTGEGTLKVRGYVGISMFGRTTEWTRVLATGKSLPQSVQ